MPLPDYSKVDTPGPLYKSVNLKAKRALAWWAGRAFSDAERDAESRTHAPPPGGWRVLMGEVSLYSLCDVASRG